MSEESEVQTTGNPIMDYAAQRNAPEQTSTTSTDAGIAEGTQTNATAEGSAGIADQTTQQTANAGEVETPAFDTAKWLSDTSEGLFTDPESLKASLPKIKGYDQLFTEKAQLEEKLKQDPFVNEFTKSLDNFIRAGKSQDEIENFITLSRLDIDAMDARDVKIMAMVNKGYTKEIASQIIERDYPLNSEDRDDSEKAIIAEELRVSALEDRIALKAFKKEITTVDNSANEQKEQLRLQEIANNTAFENTVKASVPSIVAKISGIGEINLNGKEGDEAVKLNFDLSDEFKAALPEKVEQFFMASKMEVNDENVALANRLLQAEHLYATKEAFAQQIFKHAEAITTEKIVNKYENRTGLPSESDKAIVDNSLIQAKHDFLSKVAKSTR